MPAPAADTELVLDITWSARLESPAIAPPVADESRVYVALGGGRVTARSLSDGNELWSIDLTLTTGLALDEGRLIGATDGAVVALDATSGRVVWQAPVRGGTIAPTARGGWVLASVGPELLALRGRDGHLVWRRTLTADLHAPVIVDGGRAYAPLADGTVAALDILTGNVAWRARLPASAGAVTAAGDRLFVGSADNFFYALDAHDGDRRWRWRTGADVLAPAAQDGERVYYAALDNVVRAVDFGSGVQKWRYPMDTRPLAGPVLDGDLLFVGAAGELRAVRARDGTAAGRWAAPAELTQAPLVIPRKAGGITRAVVVTGAATGDWRLYGLGVAAEPRPTPLTETPGRPLPLDGPPAPPGPPRPGGPRLL